MGKEEEKKSRKERRELFREVGKELEGHDIMDVEGNEVSRKCMSPIL